MMTNMTTDPMALFNFVPRICPACGVALEINTEAVKLAEYYVFEAAVCPGCGLKYQYVRQVDLLRAATASGGNLIDLLMD